MKRFLLITVGIIVSLKGMKSQEVLHGKGYMHGSKADNYDYSLYKMSDGRNSIYVEDTIYMRNPRLVLSKMSSQWYVISQSDLNRLLKNDNPVNDSALLYSGAYLYSPGIKLSLYSWRSFNYYEFFGESPFDPNTGVFHIYSPKTTRITPSGIRKYEDIIVLKFLHKQHWFQLLKIRGDTYNYLTYETIADGGKRMPLSFNCDSCYYPLVIPFKIQKRR